MAPATCDPLEIGTAYSRNGVSALLEDFTVPGDNLEDAVLVWFEDTLSGSNTRRRKQRDEPSPSHR